MRRALVSILTLLMLLQSTSFANFDDLPDPGGGDVDNSQPGPVVTPVPQAPGEGETFAGSLTISGMSRRTGGSVYTARLYRPVPLVRLDIRVINSKVKFYSLTAVTENGDRLEIPQFRNTSVLETDSFLSSQNLNTDKTITQIELVTESFGAEADIILTALSTSEVPKLLLKVEAPKPPPTPTPEPSPEPSPGPTPEPAPPEQEPEEGGEIRVGNIVLFNSQSVGKVVELTVRQTAVVSFGDGIREEVSVFMLEKSSRCVEGFCEGARVNYEGDTAQIINIFHSGWAYLLLGSGSRVVVDMFFISQPSDCDGQNRFCVGDKILYHNRYDGTVVAIYSNDHISIRLENRQTTMTVRPAQLAKALGCTSGSNKFCVGDRALIQNTEAKILGLYSNGTAKVLMSNQNRVLWVDQKSLSKQIRCLKNICVGQKVRYGNKQAIVKEIYSNGTARVTIGVLGREYLVRVDSLRPY